MSSQNLIRKIWLGLLVSGVLLLVFTEMLPIGHDVDMWFSNLLYDQVAGRFVLLHEGWAEKYLHNWPQNALRLLSAYMLVQVLYGAYLYRTKALNTTQKAVWRRWQALFVSTLLIALLINFIKAQTNVACPWSLSAFGGKWSYVSLFTPRPWSPDVIKCWPAGYGAAGFSILAVAFVNGWPPAMWRKSLLAGDARMPSYLSAKAFVAYALILGTLMGGMRILQGGHFISHQLWAMWWVVLLLMILVKIKIIKPE